MTSTTTKHIMRLSNTLHIAYVHTENTSQSSAQCWACCPYGWQVGAIQPKREDSSCFAHYMNRLQWHQPPQNKSCDFQIHCTQPTCTQKRLSVFFQELTLRVNPDTVVATICAGSSSPDPILLSLTLTSLAGFFCLTNINCLLVIAKSDACIKWCLTMHACISL